MVENKRIKLLINWLISQELIESQNDLGEKLGIHSKSYLSQLVNGKAFNQDGPFNELTAYWARHTWATIAASLDIPREVIAHALGHRSDYNSVTDVYIRYDERKTDQANRLVISHVLAE